MKDTGYNLMVEPLSKSGFTLLEIMIALVLIGTVLTTVLYTTNYHAEVLYENILLTEMYLLAKEKIAEMELNPLESEGSISGTELNYKNTINNIAETGITELRTTISGYDREITLREFIVRK